MSETATQLGVPDDVPEGALCLGCNYSLRGLPGNRCPECGREFDRGDPWTMNCGRPMGRIAKFISSPVGLPTVITAWIATALTVWWTSYLSWAWMAMEAATFLWAAIYAYRVVRSIARWIVTKRYRQPMRRRRQRAITTLLLITGLLIWTRAPLRLLLAIHAPAFQKLAYHYYAELPMLQTPPAPPAHVGLYECGSVSVSPNGVRLQMGDVDFVYEPYRTWSKSDWERVIEKGAYYVGDGGVESEFFAYLIRGPVFYR